MYSASAMTTFGTAADAVRFAVEISLSNSEDSMGTNFSLLSGQAARFVEGTNIRRYAMGGTCSGESSCSAGARSTTVQITATIQNSTLLRMSTPRGRGHVAARQIDGTMRGRFIRIPSRGAGRSAMCWQWSPRDASQSIPGSESYGDACHWPERLHATGPVEQRCGQSKQPGKRKPIQVRMPAPKVPLPWEMRELKLPADRRALRASSGVAWPVHTGRLTQLPARTMILPARSASVAPL